MSRAKEVRICDWIDVNPLEVRKLRGMTVDQRFATVAVAGGRVVGLWSYNVRRERGRVVLIDHGVDVVPAYRRQGLAARMWTAGIDRWGAELVRVTIETRRGAAFVAAMTVRFAGVGPRLAVDAGAWAAQYEAAVRALALRELASVRAGAPAKPKAVP